MKKTGFLYTFISVCSGTEVFPELIKQPFRRTLWHFFILAVICGFINVAFRLHPFNKSFEDCCTNLSRRFGKIEYTDKGMVPSIRPEESRSATSEDGFRVDYLANAADIKTYKPDKEFYRGIVWTPETVLFFIQYYNDDEWFVIPLLFPTKEVKTVSEALELVKLASNTSVNSSSFNILADIYQINPAENKGKAAVDFREFKSNLMLGISMTVPFVYSVFLFLFIFLNMLVFSVMYILFFTTFSYMFGRANMLKLKYTELFSLGIYTGFPGFIIATLFVALKLPVLDFQSVFLISYFFYSFAVFGKLRGDKKPPEEKHTFEF